MGFVIGLRPYSSAGNEEVGGKLLTIHLMLELRLLNSVGPGARVENEM